MFELANDLAGSLAEADIQRLFFENAGAGDACRGVETDGDLDEAGYRRGPEPLPATAAMPLWDQRPRSVSPGWSAGRGPGAAQ